MTTIPPDRRRRIAALGFDYAAQPRAALTTCNLCGASRFITLTHRDRYGYAAEASGCEACGLVFLNRPMGGSTTASIVRSSVRFTTV